MHQSKFASRVIELSHKSSHVARCANDGESPADRAANVKNAETLRLILGQREIRETFRDASQPTLTAGREKRYTCAKTRAMRKKRYASRW